MPETRRSMRARSVAVSDRFRAERVERRSYAEHPEPVRQIQTGLRGRGVEAGSVNRLADSSVVARPSESIVNKERRAATSSSRRPAADSARRPATGMTVAHSARIWLSIVYLAAIDRADSSASVRPPPISSARDNTAIAVVGEGGPELVVTECLEEVDVTEMQVPHQVDDSVRRSRFHLRWRIGETGATESRGVNQRHVLEPGCRPADLDVINRRAGHVLEVERHRTGVPPEPKRPLGPVIEDRIDVVGKRMPVPGDVPGAFGSVRGGETFTDEAVDER